MTVAIKIAEIQKARLNKGYSQRELAKVAGVSTLAVNYMETKKSTPRPATLKKICMALDIDVMQVCEING